MEGMVEFVGNFWGDLTALALSMVGSILSVIIWHRLNKVFARLSRLPIGITSGVAGGLIGFIAGILLEGNIESLVKRLDKHKA